ncbi:unnamed protein product [Ilex paraguariensis]|uniref:Uncharacterized protein n=1 Tax=Ilex paraguariensis TaxID=185542 RepID=A0ABC8S128_9AQUA
MDRLQQLMAILGMDQDTILSVVTGYLLTSPWALLCYPNCLQEALGMLRVPLLSSSLFYQSAFLFLLVTGFLKANLIFVGHATTHQLCSHGLTRRSGQTTGRCTRSASPLMEVSPSYVLLGPPVRTSELIRVAPVSWASVVGYSLVSCQRVLPPASLTCQPD